jgi:dual specificity tyrosine-phosphorylation-regulated kinase 2/3/4
VGSIKIEEVIGSTDPTFIDFIQRCLEWDPVKRITPADALMHEWVIKGLPEEIKEQHIQQLRR